MIPRPLHQNKSEFPEKVSKFTFFSSKNEYLIATTNCFVRSFFFFFFYHGFLHRGWRFSGQQGKRRDHLLFHSTTPTHSRTLRHVFATLYVRWVSRIFNRNACVYQTATRWDLPPYQITIWVIDWWCNVCLFTWWIDTRFLLQRFDIGSRWIWTRIEYHPCITSEPTNQAC